LKEFKAFFITIETYLAIVEPVYGKDVVALY
jgi:hypothetical protein